MDELVRLINSMSMQGKEFITLYQLKCNCIDDTNIADAVSYAIDSGLAISVGGVLYFKAQDVVERFVH